MFIIQAGREQPHLLLGVAQLGRQVERCRLKCLEPVKVALLFKKADVARVAGKSAVQQQAVRLVGVGDDILGINLHRLVQ